MNAKTLIATALVLSFAGARRRPPPGGTRDFRPQWSSSLTRTEVMATLKATPAGETTSRGQKPRPRRRPSPR